MVKNECKQRSICEVLSLYQDVVNNVSSYNIKFKCVMSPGDRRG